MGRYGSVRLRRDTPGMSYLGSSASLHSIWPSGSSVGRGPRCCYPARTPRHWKTPGLGKPAKQLGTIFILSLAGSPMLLSARDFGAMGIRRSIGFEMVQVAYDAL